jgi:hypothetical protein
MLDVYDYEYLNAYCTVFIRLRLSSVSGRSSLDIFSSSPWYLLSMDLTRAVPLVDHCSLLSVVNARYSSANQNVLKMPSSCICLHIGMA